jgi:hypothetical protein
MEISPKELDRAIRRLNVGCSLPLSHAYTQKFSESGQVLHRYDFAIDRTQYSGNSTSHTEIRAKRLAFLNLLDSMPSNVIETAGFVRRDHPTSDLYDPNADGHSMTEVRFGPEVLTGVTAASLARVKGLTPTKTTATGLITAAATYHLKRFLSDSAKSKTAVVHEVTVTTATPNDDTPDNLPLDTIQMIKETLVQNNSASDSDHFTTLMEQLRLKISTHGLQYSELSCDYTFPTIAPTGNNYDKVIVAPAMMRDQYNLAGRKQYDLAAEMLASQSARPALMLHQKMNCKAVHSLLRASDQNASFVFSKDSTDPRVVWMRRADNTRRAAGWRCILEHIGRQISVNEDLITPSISNPSDSFTAAQMDRRGHYSKAISRQIAVYRSSASLPGKTSVSNVPPSEPNPFSAKLRHKTFVNGKANLPSILKGTCAKNQVITFNVYLGDVYAGRGYRSGNGVMVPKHVLKGAKQELTIGSGEDIVVLTNPQELQTDLLYFPFDGRPYNYDRPPRLPLPGDVVMVISPATTLPCNPGTDERKIPDFQELLCINKSNGPGSAIGHIPGISSIISGLSGSVCAQYDRGTETLTATACLSTMRIPTSTGVGEVDLLTVVYPRGHDETGNSIKRDQKKHMCAEAVANILKKSNTNLKSVDIPMGGGKTFHMTRELRLQSSLPILCIEPTRSTAIGANGGVKFQGISNGLIMGGKTLMSRDGNPNLSADTILTTTCGKFLVELLKQTYVNALSEGCIVLLDEAHTLTTEYLAANIIFPSLAKQYPNSVFVTMTATPNIVSDQSIVIKPRYPADHFLQLTNSTGSEPPMNSKIIHVGEDLVPGGKLYLPKPHVQRNSMVFISNPGLFPSITEKLTTAGYKKIIPLQRDTILKYKSQLRNDLTQTGIIYLCSAAIGPGVNMSVAYGFSDGLQRIMTAQPLDPSEPNYGGFIATKSVEICQEVAQQNRGRVGRNSHGSYHSMKPISSYKKMTKLSEIDPDTILGAEAIVRGFDAKLNLDGKTLLTGTDFTEEDVAIYEANRNNKYSTALMAVLNTRAFRELGTEGVSAIWGVLPTNHENIFSRDMHPKEKKHFYGTENVSATVRVPWLHCSRDLSIDDLEHAGIVVSHENTHVSAISKPTEDIGYFRWAARNTFLMARNIRDRYNNWTTSSSAEPDSGDPSDSLNTESSSSKKKKKDGFLFYATDKYYVVKDYAAKIIVKKAVDSVLYDYTGITLDDIWSKLVPVGDFFLNMARVSYQWIRDFVVYTRKTAYSLFRSVGNKIIQLLPDKVYGSFAYFGQNLQIQYDSIVDTLHQEWRDAIHTNGDSSFHEMSDNTDTVEVSFLGGIENSCSTNCWIQMRAILASLEYFFIYLIVDSYYKSFNSNYKQIVRKIFPTVCEFVFFVPRQFYHLFCAVLETPKAILSRIQDSYRSFVHNVRGSVSEVTGILPRFEPDTGTIPHILRDPVTLQLLDDPVILESGISISRSTFDRLTPPDEHFPRCPVTRTSIDQMSPPLNRALNKIRESWLMDNPEYYEWLDEHHPVSFNQPEDIPTSPLLKKLNKIYLNVRNTIVKIVHSTKKTLSQPPTGPAREFSCYVERKVSSAYSKIKLFLIDFLKNERFGPKTYDAQSQTNSDNATIQEPTQTFLSDLETRDATAQTISSFPHRRGYLNDRFQQSESERYESPDDEMYSAYAGSYNSENYDCPHPSGSDARSTSTTEELIGRFENLMTDDASPCIMTSDNSPDLMTEDLSNTEVSFASSVEYARIPEEAWSVIKAGLSSIIERLRNIKIKDAIPAITETVRRWIDSFGDRVREIGEMIPKCATFVFDLETDDEIVAEPLPDVVSRSSFSGKILDFFRRVASAIADWFRKYSILNKNGCGCSGNLIGNGFFSVEDSVEVEEVEPSQEFEPSRTMVELARAGVARVYTLISGRALNYFGYVVDFFKYLVEIVCDSFTGIASVFAKKTDPEQVALALGATSFTSSGGSAFSTCARTILCPDFFLVLTTIGVLVYFREKIRCDINRLIDNICSPRTLYRHFVESLYDRIVRGFALSIWESLIHGTSLSISRSSDTSDSSDETLRFPPSTGSETVAVIPPNQSTANHVDPPRNLFTHSTGANANDHREISDIEEESDDDPEQSGLDISPESSGDEEPPAPAASLLTQGSSFTNYQTYGDENIVFQPYPTHSESESDDEDNTEPRVEDADSVGVSFRPSEDLTGPVSTIFNSIGNKIFSLLNRAISSVADYILPLIASVSNFFDIEEPLRDLRSTVSSCLTDRKIEASTIYSIMFAARFLFSLFYANESNAPDDKFPIQPVERGGWKRSLVTLGNFLNNLSFTAFSFLSPYDLKTRLSTFMYFLFSSPAISLCYYAVSSIANAFSFTPAQYSFSRLRQWVSLSLQDSRTVSYIVNSVLLVSFFCSSFFTTTFLPSPINALSTLAPSLFNVEIIWFSEHEAPSPPPSSPSSLTTTYMFLILAFRVIQKITSAYVNAYDKTAKAAEENYKTRMMGVKARVVSNPNISIRAAHEPEHVSLRSDYESNIFSHFTTSAFLGFFIDQIFPTDGLFFSTTLFSYAFTSLLQLFDVFSTDSLNTLRGVFFTSGLTSILLPKLPLSTFIQFHFAPVIAYKMFYSIFSGWANMADPPLFDTTIQSAALDCVTTQMPTKRFPVDHKKSGIYDIGNWLDKQQPKNTRKILEFLVDAQSYYYALVTTLAHIAVEGIFPAIGNATYNHGPTVNFVNDDSGYFKKIKYFIRTEAAHTVPGEPNPVEVNPREHFCGSLKEKFHQFRKNISERFLDNLKKHEYDLTRPMQIQTSSDFFNCLVLFSSIGFQSAEIVLASTRKDCPAVNQPMASFVSARPMNPQIMSKKHLEHYTIMGFNPLGWGWRLVQALAYTFSLSMHWFMGVAVDVGDFFTESILNSAWYELAQREEMYKRPDQSVLSGFLGGIKFGIFESYNNAHQVFHPSLVRSPFVFLWWMLSFCSQLAWRVPAHAFFGCFEVTRGSQIHAMTNAWFGAGPFRLIMMTWITPLVVLVYKNLLPFAMSKLKYLTVPEIFTTVFRPLPSITVESILHPIYNWFTTLFNWTSSGGVFFMPFASILVRHILNKFTDPKTARRCTAISVFTVFSLFHGISINLCIMQVMIHLTTYIDRNLQSYAPLGCAYPKKITYGAGDTKWAWTLPRISAVPFSFAMLVKTVHLIRNRSYAPIGLQTFGPLIYLAASVAIYCYQAPIAERMADLHHRTDETPGHEGKLMRITEEQITPDEFGWMRYSSLMLCYVITNTYIIRGYGIVPLLYHMNNSNWGFLPPPTSEKIEIVGPTMTPVRYDFDGTDPIAHVSRRIKRARFPENAIDCIFRANNDAYMQRRYVQLGGVGNQVPDQAMSHSKLFFSAIVPKLLSPKIKYENVANLACGSGSALWAIEHFCRDSGYTPAFHVASLQSEPKYMDAYSGHYSELDIPNGDLRHTNLGSALGAIDDDSGPDLIMSEHFNKNAQSESNIDENCFRIQRVFQLASELYQNNRKRMTVAITFETQHQAYSDIINEIVEVGNDHTIRIVPAFGLDQYSTTAYLVVHFGVKNANLPIDAMIEKATTSQLRFFESLVRDHTPTESLFSESVSPQVVQYDQVLRKKYSSDNYNINATELDAVESVSQSLYARVAFLVEKRPVTQHVLKKFGIDEISDRVHDRFRVVGSLGGSISPPKIQTSPVMHRAMTASGMTGTLLHKSFAHTDVGRTPMEYAFKNRLDVAPTHDHENIELYKIVYDLITKEIKKKVRELECDQRSTWESLSAEIFPPLDREGMRRASNKKGGSGLTEINRMVDFLEVEDFDGVMKHLLNEYEKMNPEMLLLSFRPKHEIKKKKVGGQAATTRIITHANLETRQLIQQFLTPFLDYITLHHLIPSMADATGSLGAGPRIVKDFGRYKNPTAASNDIKSFDVRQSPFYLSLECEMMCKLLPRSRKLIEIYYASFIYQTGVMEGGLLVEMIGMRGSGMRTTYFGNTIMNLVQEIVKFIKSGVGHSNPMSSPNDSDARKTDIAQMIQQSQKKVIQPGTFNMEHVIKDFREVYYQGAVSLLLSGDDSVATGETAVMKILINMVSHYVDSGFILKNDPKVTQDIGCVDFCSHHYVETVLSNGITTAINDRSVERILTSMMYDASYTQPISKYEQLQLLKAKAQSTFISYPTNPYVSAICSAIISETDRIPDHDYPFREWRKKLLWSEGKSPVNVLQKLVHSSITSLKQLPMNPIGLYVKFSKMDSGKSVRVSDLPDPTKVYDIVKSITRAAVLETLTSDVREVKPKVPRDLILSIANRNSQVIEHRVFRTRYSR